MGLDEATKKTVHDTFGETHEILGFAMWGLWALHVGAALKHQFIDRDGLIGRMWPGRA
jgi:cytochrome b561